MLITFEGLDKSGKTSAIEAIKKRIKNTTIRNNVVFTSELYPSRFSDNHKLIDVINNNKNENADILLFTALRRLHYDETIRPALEDGKIVICDRYIDSTIAYQGYGRHLSRKSMKVTKWINYCVKQPDYTFLMVTDPTTSFMRMVNEGATDRFEKKGIDYYRDVANGFQKLASRNSKRYITINTIDRTQESCITEVIKAFDKIVVKHRKKLEKLRGSMKW